MSIPVTCPSCGHQTNAKDSAAGKRGKCPKCGGIVQVPGAPPPPVVDAEVVDGYAMDFPANLLSDRMASEPAAGAQSAEPPGERRPCPVCGEMISITALKCRFCNEIFDPQLKKQAAKQAKAAKGSFIGGEGDDLTGGEWVVAILCSTIGCIVGIIWMIQGKPKGKKMFLVSLIVTVVWTAIRLAMESSK